MSFFWNGLLARLSLLRPRTIRFGAVVRLGPFLITPTARDTAPDDRSLRHQAPIWGCRCLARPARQILPGGNSPRPARMHRSLPSGTKGSPSSRFSSWSSSSAFPLPLRFHTVCGSGGKGYAASVKSDRRSVAGAEESHRTDNARYPAVTTAAGAATAACDTVRPLSPATTAGQPRTTRLATASRSPRQNWSASTPFYYDGTRGGLQPETATVCPTTYSTSD